MTHANKPFITLKKDRLLYETKGYRELIQRKEIRQLPCFAHSYQMASMLDYYGGSGSCVPYFGYARFSEFDLKFKKTKAPKRFHFLTHHSLSKQPTGYDLVSSDIMLICKNSPPKVVNIFQMSKLEKPCEYSHYFLRYEFERSAL